MRPIGFCGRNGWMFNRDTLKKTSYVRDFEIQTEICIPSYFGNPCNSGSDRNVNGLLRYFIDFCDVLDMLGQLVTKEVGCYLCRLVANCMIDNLWRYLGVDSRDASAKSDTRRDPKM